MAYHMPYSIHVKNKLELNELSIWNALGIIKQKPVEKIENSDIISEKINNWLKYLAVGRGEMNDYDN